MPSNRGGRDVWQDFCDLTLANETELFVVATGEPAPEWLMQLFEDVRDRVTPGVLEGAGGVLASPTR